MQTVLWFAGVCFVLLCMRFIFMVFKRLWSGESINGTIDKMEKKMQNAANDVANSIKNRKKKEEEKPIVTIR